MSVSHSWPSQLASPMQANLGMKRCKQCEELLALASWLLYSEPKHAVPLMKAQLNRLYGQLHALMGRYTPLFLTFPKYATCFVNLLYLRCPLSSIPNGCLGVPVAG